MNQFLASPDHDFVEQQRLPIGNDTLVLRIVIGPENKSLDVREILNDNRLETNFDEVEEV